MMGAKVIEVIVTDMELRGGGIERDPMRRILQYWSPEGRLLAEVDPIIAEYHHFNPLAGGWNSPRREE